MTIYIGNDHRGAALKAYLIPFLSKHGHAVSDCTPESHPDDDYTESARTVVAKLQKDPKSRGILICGSGAGVSIAANRFPDIRAALGFDVNQVTDARSEDDINVLALSADYTDGKQAEKLIDAFLSVPFTDKPRYRRRVEQLNHLP